MEMWNMNKIISLAIGITCLGIIDVQGSGEQLVYVQALWRHGDRAPGGLPYPKDKNKETAWPRGWAQLTNLGIMQLYELGQFFRQRYGSFIKEFKLEDVGLISSSSDRAIVSGQAMLRGFFPASGQNQWLSGEQWQPLPFEVASNNAELKPTDFDCPVYDRDSADENEELFRRMGERYSDFFDFLANVTGYMVVNLKKASSLYDIQREIDHNMTQPQWVYQTWPEYDDRTTLDIITRLKRIRRIAEFDSPVKARLRGGLLMDDWVRRVWNISLGVPVKPRKMKLFSGHDGTVLALMYALGVGNGLMVPHGACLIMEVYKSADNITTTVKLFFKNDTNTGTVHQLTVPGCDLNNCTVAKLEESVASRLVRGVQQLNRDCGVKSATSLVATSSLTVLLVVLLLHACMNHMFTIK